MLNLLIMPLAKAEHIKSLWDSTGNYEVSFLIVSMLLAIVFVGILTIFLHRRDKDDKLIKDDCGIVISVICIIACITVFLILAFTTVTKRTNIGAANNVGCYYKMKHIRKIYRTLPCKPRVKRLCKTGSVNSAANAREKATHTFTKKDATDEYIKLRHAYRHMIRYSSNKDANDTKSIHPHKPQWYDYL